MIRITRERAQLLTYTGFTVLASATLIVVRPQIGTLALELLLGSALAAIGISALRRKARVGEVRTARDKSQGRPEWFDRYTVVMVVVVIVIQGGAAGWLRSVGWPEGFIRVFPLLLLGLVLLLKTAILRRIERYQVARSLRRLLTALAEQNKKTETARGITPGARALKSGGTADPEPWWKHHLRPGPNGKSFEVEENE